MALTIGNIATSATNMTFTVGPSQASASYVVVNNQGTNPMAVGLSGTPGTNWIEVPPGGFYLFNVANANLLYVANTTGSVAQQCAFLTY